MRSYTYIFCVRAIHLTQMNCPDLLPRRAACRTAALGTEHAAAIAQLQAGVEGAVQQQLAMVPKALPPPQRAIQLPGAEDLAALKCPPEDALMRAYRKQREVCMYVLPCCWVAERLGQVLGTTCRLVCDALLHEPSQRAMRHDPLPLGVRTPLPPP